MIEKIEPELVDDSFFISHKKNLIPIQDITNIDIDPQKITNNIYEKNKEYLYHKNKYFFREFENLYINNILLKNKLNEVLNEKKMLNQLITKLENQIKISKKVNNLNNENNIIKNNNKSLNIELYKKKKRKRRKKSEIKNIFSCPFHNCNKRYPSKSSLNMHIKLKHQKDKLYIFDNDNKK